MRISINLYFGRVAGSPMMNALVRIFADGSYIESFNQDTVASPGELRLSTEGVREIWIEVVTFVPPHQTMTYAFSGFAE